MRIAVLGLLLLAVPARRHPDLRPPPDAAQAAALLDLLATDADAPAPGPADHEQRERSAAAAAVLAAVGRLEAPRELELARQLQVLADAGANPEQAAAVARLLQRSIESRFGLDFEPRRAPDLEDGARLYAQSCAACHEGAVQLETQPPDLRDRAATRRFTPRHVFHAVGTGIPETAMPSFGDALTDDQRWDVAFYVAALPSRTSIGGGRTAARDYRQLAGATDDLLRLQLQAGGAADVEGALSAVRRGPFAKGAEQIPLVVPSPLELLREERRDETGAPVERAVLRAPRSAGLLAAMRNLSQQMLWRGEKPPVDLTLLVQDPGGAPIGQCDLIADEEVACDVVPGIESPSSTTRQP